jgi:hypothetical protein
MRSESYLKRASRRFLEGTKCKTPCEAVETGGRSLEAWTQVLTEEREFKNADFEGQMIAPSTVST